jgi:hypothetical protein
LGIAECDCVITDANDHVSAAAAAQADEVKMGFSVEMGTPFEFETAVVPEHTPVVIVVYPGKPFSAPE